MLAGVEAAGAGRNRLGETSEEARRPAPVAGLPQTGARLSQALFLYVLVITLIVTLAPFRFEAADTSRVMLSFVEWFELFANVLLFLPLGFLLPLTGRPALISPWQVLVAGLALSAAIELVQLFEPARYTSPVDVAANGLGAALGASCQRWISARLRVNARLVGRLSLEQPLMGLLYLLLPLLWVGSLAVGDQPLRLLGIGALGLLGARLLAALQRYHFGPAGVLGVRGVGLLAGGCMLLGAFPVAPAHPWVVAGLAVGVAGAAMHEASGRPGLRAERRFEPIALRRLAPCLVAYLAALAFVPLLYGSAEWHSGFGIPALRTPSRLEMVRLLESSAALTFLGYLLAEARGRRELPAAASLPALLTFCGGTAAVIEISSGFQSAYGASAAQTMLLTAAGLLGGWIYHAQRTHIQALLADPGAAPGGWLPGPRARDGAPPA